MSDIPPAVVGGPDVMDPQVASEIVTPTTRDRNVLALQTQVAHLVELAAGLEPCPMAEGFDPHHQLGRLLRMEWAADAARDLAHRLKTTFGALCLTAEREARAPAAAPEGATT